MNIVRRADAQLKQFPTCEVMEYQTDTPSINIAKVKISGRYPQMGWAKNTECVEMAYVISGAGKVVIEGEEIELAVGDVISIDPNEKFYWEGDMELIMPCAPAWHPAQYQQGK